MQRVLQQLKDIFAEFTTITAVYNVIDILILSVLLYFLLVFLKKQNAGGIVKFLILTLFLFLGITVLSDYLRASARLVLNFGTLVIAIIAILFPYELRRGIWKLSNPKATVAKFSGKYDCSDEQLREAINEIIKAIQHMSKRQTGALLVFANTDISSQILESGVSLGAELSSGLLESIFITKGPLHDGAVIIRGNKIIAAGCFLPLSQDLNVPKELGTRHRAALGVTESQDVSALIVSEETGVISMARGGVLSRYFDSKMMLEALEQIYGLKAVATAKHKKKERSGYGKEK